MKKIALFLLLTVFCAPAAQANSQSYAAWLQNLRQEALSSGISAATVSQALPDTLVPIPRIIELDRKQPEGTVTFDDYLGRTLNNQRIQQGQRQMMDHRQLLKAVSEKYGVQPEIIVALWGMETSYGKNTGGYGIINALATLAYDGRRSEYFRGELLKALKIIDEDHIPLAQFKGSWAGAMGQCQFMPSSFFNFAEDYNGDGKRDIWGTEADVFASAANYLSKSGWKKNQTWGHEVQLPKDFSTGLIGLETRQSLQFWHDKGVRLPNGKSIPFEGSYQASLIQPDKSGGRALLVYDNYRVILLWNKSKYFATSIGLLSDHLKGW